MPRRIRTVASLLCASFLAGCVTPPSPVAVRAVADDLPSYTPANAELSGELDVRGGGTMGRIIEPLLAAFTRAYPAVFRRTELLGSSNVPPTLGRSCNVGVMSRRMTDAERADVTQRDGHPPLEIVLAHDAILVMVNQTNPIDGFSVAQLDALFGAERYRHYGTPVVTWGDFGLGGDWKTKLVAPYGLLEEGQGTVESFRKLVLMGGPINRSVNNIPYPENEFGQAVAANAAGVSYNIYHAPVPGARAVPVSGDAGGFVSATPDAIASGKYPLSRDLYLYVAGGETPPAVREFVKFCLSRQGQAIVAESSAVSITTGQAKDQLTRLVAMRPATRP